MDLGTQRESKNYKDDSNLINRRGPNFQARQLIDMFWRRMHETPNDFSTIPHQTDPGEPIPLIPYHDLSDDEKTLVKDYGFDDKDITLMRMFKTNPGQVMEGWKLQRGPGK